MSSAATYPREARDPALAAVPAVPYRGIRPFRYADHAIFFARDEETRHLLRLVVVYRGTLLYGASGAGKSSLINAGLIPAATAHGYRPERIRVQARAGEELVVERFDDESPPAVYSVAAFHERIRSAEPSQRPLLVVDQLEELVTLFDTPALARVQREIAALLMSVLEDEALPVKVLLVFREDYLAQLKQVLGARPELIDQALRLTPPTPAALPKIIRGPFERYPGHFAREISPDVAATLQLALVERFKAGELSLSEVQTVCLRLWQSTDPRALLEARGIQGILEDYLGEELDAFPADLKYPAVALLARMVTASGTRNVISAEDLVARVREDDDIPPDRLKAALGRLENESKLVARERRRDVELYEITSEFLVPWIRQRQQELVRQNERRAERRRLLIVASTMVAVLAVGGLIFFLLAQAARNEERRADHARSLSLSSAAVSQLQVDPAAALTTSLEAYDSDDTPEARAAIRAVVGQSRLENILRDPSLVWAAAYSGDGTVLAMASDDHRVTLWDPTTGTRRQVLRSSSFPYTVDVDQPGRLIAVGQNDGSAQVWDLPTGGDVVVRHSAGLMNDVALSPDGEVLATSGQDGTARLWDPRSGRALATLRHRDIYVGTVAFNRSGRLVVTSGWDRTARVWRVPDGAAVATLRHGSDVDDAEFSPDGRRVVTAGADARIWDMHGRLEHVLQGHVDGVARASFSPDGSIVATAGYDGTARLWRSSTGRSVALLAGHSEGIDELEFSPTGDMLLTASADGTARLWSVPRAELLAVLEGHVADITDAHFSPDGRQIVTASRDHSARLWRAAGIEQPVATLGDGEPGVVTESPNGRWLAASFEDGAVQVWPVDAWDGGTQLAAGQQWGAVAFSPDSRLLATSGRPGGVRLWSAPDWRPAGVLRTRGAVDGVAFRRDGRVIATVSRDGAQLWDAATRRPLPSASVRLRDTPDTGTPSEPTFSRDGQLVLFSGGAAQVWAVGRPTTTLLTIGKYAANPASMSANGNVVLGDEDGKTAVWRIRGTRLEPLARRAGGNSALSPTGALAVSAAESGTEIWATREGRRVRSLPTSDGADWATFSPTGRFVATSAYDSNVRLFDTATGTEIASLAGGRPYDIPTTATFSSGDTRVLVASDRLRVHRCDACGPFAQVLALARRRAATLGRG